MPEDDDILDPTGPSAEAGDALSDDDIASVLDDASLEDDPAASPDAPSGPQGTQEGAGDPLETGGGETIVSDPILPVVRIIDANGERMPAAKAAAIGAFDFANPHFLSEKQMRRVRLRHEQFIFNAASRLSMQLQTDFSLRLSQLEIQPYQDFTDSISNPSHIILFRLNKVKGVGVVAMGARLAMTVVDRLLGGGGQSVNEERFLSDLEIVLLEDFLQLLLAQWCEQWGDFEKLHAEIIGYENHGRFLQTASRDAQMLVLSMEAGLGDCTAAIQFGVPYFSVEPIIRQMQSQADAHQQPSPEKNRRNWWASCDGIEVEVKAEWKAFECTVSDLLRLRPGDVLKLDPGLIENTEIWCHNKLRFKGKAGVQNNRVAVEVKEKTNPEEESIL